MRRLDEHSAHAQVADSRLPPLQLAKRISQSRPSHFQYPHTLEPRRNAAGPHRSSPIVGVNLADKTGRSVHALHKRRLKIR